MAEAMILRRGGGSGKSLAEGFAVIAAEYPAGSICTCEKGGVILRAKGTGGAAAFSIPDAGTWVVRCTDGTNEDHRSINITAQGQLKTAYLYYESVLLKDGVLKEGYGIVGSAGLDGGIQESSGGGFYLTPVIDMTGLSVVSVSATLTYVGAGGYTSAIGFSRTPGEDLEPADLSCAGSWNASTYGSTVTRLLNVTELEGPYYLCSARVGNQLKVIEISMH